MNRVLSDVIDSMVETIPVGEEDLRADLADLRGSYMCSAPEMHHVWWQEVHTVITDKWYEYPEEDVPEWLYEIISIFSTRPIEVVKEQLTSKGE